MKRFVVFSDEGIHKGPRADIYYEQDGVVQSNREEFESLDVGEAKFTDESGVTFTQVILRVPDAGAPPRWREKWLPSLRQIVIKTAAAYEAIHSNDYRQLLDCIRDIRAMTDSPGGDGK